MLILSGLAHFFVHIVHLEDTPVSLAQLPYFLDMAVGTHATLLFATPLVLMGLTGLFVRHAEKIRWWGWIGYACIFFMFIFELIHGVLQIYQYPVLFDGITTEAQLKDASDMALKTLNHEGFPKVLQLVAMPLVLGGFILLTIALYRARVYSKWLALWFLMMPVSFFLPWDSVGKYVFPVSFLVYAAYGAILVFEGRAETKVRDEAKAA